MRSKGEIKGLCISGNRLMSLRPSGGRSLIYPDIVRIGFLVVLFLLMEPCWATFQVQPMRVELFPERGQTLQQEIQIESVDPNGPQTISIQVVELTQHENGLFRIIDPNSTDPNEVIDMSKLSSCRDWIRVDKQTVRVAPMGLEPLLLTIRAPGNARGFYGAALCVQRKIVGQVGIIITLVVPILVQMQGTAPRHEVQLTGIGMELRPAEKEKPVTTLATMSIENSGGTYSVLRGLVRISSFVNERWREVTVSDLSGYAIMPGSKLVLKGDIGRSLPAGKYRLEGVLFVDNRRLPQVEEEIDFAGDPQAKKLSGDAPLKLDQKIIYMEGQPGATRQASIAIQNLSEDAVNIKISLNVPAILAETEVGGIPGAERSCASWLDIQPKDFTLRPNEGRQTVRVVSRMPNPDVAYSNYYAYMILQASYDDGQNAGSTIVPVCVSNKQVANQPAAQNEYLVISELGGSRYFVNANFTNVGNVHFEPQCRARLETQNGMPYAFLLLTDSSTSGYMMIPHEQRQFSGIIDLSAVPDGFYRLSAALQYAPEGSVTAIKPVRVSTLGGKKSLEIISTTEYETALNVKWQ